MAKKEEDESAKKRRTNRPFPAATFEEPLAFAKSMLDFGSGQQVRSAPPTHRDSGQAPTRATPPLSSSGLARGPICPLVWVTIEVPVALTAQRIWRQVLLLDGSSGQARG